MRKYSEDGEILNMIDDITESELKLKNFEYEKQKYLDNIEKEISENFKRIELISNEYESEDQNFQHYQSKMENEKRDLINYSKQVEDNINFYKDKLNEYHIFLKRQQIDEEYNMLEEEYISIEFQRNLLIPQRLNYEELLRLFILETFSGKLKQNYIPQNLLIATDLNFLKCEIYYVFKQKFFSEQIFKFLYDYINENIEYLEVDLLLNNIIDRLQLNEIEEFFLIWAKLIENLIVGKNYISYSQTTANFNFGKIVLYLKIVVKLYYFLCLIDKYDQFLFNDYDIRKNLLNLETSKLGNVNYEAKTYLHIIKDGKLKELNSEYNRIIDLIKDLDNEIKRVISIKDNKLSHLNKEIYRLTQENKNLHLTKEDTVNYIDSQRNIILKLYQKKKERLESTFYKIKQRDFNEQLGNTEEIDHVSSNLNKLKLSKFSTNMKESLLQFPQEDCTNNHITYLKQSFPGNIETKIEETGVKDNPDYNRENIVEAKNEVTANKENTYINNYQIMKSTSNVIFTSKNYIGKKTIFEADKRLEIFKVPRSECKLIERKDDRKSNEDNGTVKKIPQNELYNNEHYKLKIKFEYFGCPNESFVKLEKLRPLLEGFRVFKRINFLNGKKLPEFDPFKGSENSPESIGFFYSFLYLSKHLDKVVFEKLNEPSISSELNIQNFENIYVPNTSKVVLQVYKINKKLIKTSKTIEEYLLINRKMFEKNEELYKVISNEKLRNRCINKPFFLVYIMMKNKLRMEIVSNSYNDFKYILNSLNLLMNDYKALIPLSGRIDQRYE